MKILVSSTELEVNAKHPINRNTALISLTKQGLNPLPEVVKELLVRGADVTAKGVSGGNGCSGCGEPRGEYRAFDWACAIYETYERSCKGKQNYNFNCAKKLYENVSLLKTAHAPGDTVLKIPDTLVGEVLPNIATSDHRGSYPFAHQFAYDFSPWCEKMKDRCKD